MATDLSKGNLNAKIHVEVVILNKNIRTGLT